ncbi:MAG: HAMP domain-containing protein [Planctomycetes bacterium]|nr:HAMP domain-containing protein [Planctomycetota bacterium]
MRWLPRGLSARFAARSALAFALLLVVHDVAIYAWVRHEVYEALQEEWDRGVPPERIDRGPAWERKVAGVEHELDELIAAMLLVIVPGSLLAGAFGFVLSRRSLAPVGELARHAERITAERLSEKLVVADPEGELGRLASTFNGMTARLDASFAALRRFTANVSHELRTPLAAVRAIGEAGLRRPGDAAALRDVVGSMLEEVDGLSRLVESMLELARADDGRLQLSVVAVDLAELATEVVEQLAPLAEEKRLRVRVESPSPSRCVADRSLVRRAIANLLDNAIKHSPAEGEIVLRARGAGEEALLEVLDEGQGIAPADHARIFERFLRLDASRARDPTAGHAHGGAGLGLALARASIAAHGGRIEVESDVGAGARFRIALPSRPSPS